MDRNSMPLSFWERVTNSIATHLIRPYAIRELPGWGKLLHFFVDRRGKVTGPVTDDDVRDALREGKLGAGARFRLAGSDLWASPRAFVATITRALFRLPVNPPRMASRSSR